MGNINESSIDYWKTRVQEMVEQLEVMEYQLSSIFILQMVVAASAVEKMVEITRYFL